MIVTGIPHNVHHNGGRLAFGPDGYLYATTGEAQQPALAQDRSSLGGKILRMTTAGRPAPGNPFDTLVWSYGHRNVQGIAWDTAGRLWASEFGDHSEDELNLIQPGRNYGWPQTEGRTTRRGMTGPVAQWGPPEDSPSGIASRAARCGWPPFAGNACGASRSTARRSSQIRRTSSSVATAGCAACSRSGRTPCS